MRLFVAVAANAFGHYLHMSSRIALGQLDVGCHHIIQAKGILALGADKVNMMIVVMAFRTFILAERIAHRIICRGNGMDEAFVHKGLQGAVHRNPVKLFAGPFLNIAMGQGTGMLQEELEDLLPAFCHTQVVALQQVVCPGDDINRVCLRHTQI